MLVRFPNQCHVRLSVDFLVREPASNYARPLLRALGAWELPGGSKGLLGTLGPAGALRPPPRRSRKLPGFLGPQQWLWIVAGSLFIVLSKKRFSFWILAARPGHAMNSLMFCFLLLLSPASRGVASKLTQFQEDQFSQGFSGAFLS